MTHRTNRTDRGGFFSVLTLTLLLGLAASPASAAKLDPFKTLLGSWKGGGTFSLTDGTKERISCNGYYTGGGSQLGLAILCKGPNNKIHMRGKLSLNGSQISGHWEERTYHAEGALKGKATNKRLSMHISGNVSGSMTVAYSKRQQNVTIRTSGTALKTVSIKLSR